MQSREFDIIVVGAGIAGTAAAYSLGMAGRKVLLIERSWKEPDRIVGELLQPGGIEALNILGMQDCIEGIDGIAVKGYCVLRNQEEVLINYPEKKFKEGISFHHGKFITSLRQKAKSCPNVHCLEGTVSELVQCDISGRYIGVKAKVQGVSELYFGDLTVVADGCNSKFRKQFIPKTVAVKSYFVGMILKNCDLPAKNRGHVVLAKPSPILMYQIGTEDTRILVDIPGPLPSVANGDMERYMRDIVGPQLPSQVLPSFLEALEREPTRSMPNSWLPPSKNTTPGVFLIGDCQNMRHPLTGGGMSVAFWDVVHLRNSLENIPDLAEFTQQLDDNLQLHHWNRKSLSSVINILANALYALFSANDDPYICELQNACFEYFKLGGRCVSTPAGLLGAVIPEPLTLVGHFFAVACYGMVLILCRSPFNLFKCFMVIYKACVIIAPLLLAEIQ